jgi:hypothetical protein
MCVLNCGYIAAGIEIALSIKQSRRTLPPPQPFR